MKVYYVVIARIHAPRVEISCVTYSRGNSRCKIRWWVVREMSISRTKRLRRNEGCQKERAARETIQPPTRYVITRGKAIDRSTDKYSISNWRATDTSSLAHDPRLFHYASLLLRQASDGISMSFARRSMRARANFYPRERPCLFASLSTLCGCRSLSRRWKTFHRFAPRYRRAVAIKSEKTRAAV